MTPDLMPPPLAAEATDELPLFSLLDVEKRFAIDGGRRELRALEKHLKVLRQQCSEANAAADCGILIPYARTEPRHLGTNYLVDPEAMDTVINNLLTIDVAQKQALGSAARLRFLEIDTGFHQRLSEALEAY